MRGRHHRNCNRPCAQKMLFSPLRACELTTRSALGERLRWLPRESRGQLDKRSSSARSRALHSPQAPPHSREQAVRPPAADTHHHLFPESKALQISSCGCPTGSHSLLSILTDGNTTHFACVMCLWVPSTRGSGRAPARPARRVP
jgi:hypothetical protein